MTYISLYVRASRHLIPLGYFWIGFKLSLSLFFSLGFDRQRNSLRTLSYYLKQFEEIDSLPRNIKKLCERFRNADELSEELISREAVVHKSCISLYNKQKLARKRKNNELNKENNNESSNVDQVEDSQCTQEKRPKRSLDTSDINSRCFFAWKLKYTRIFINVKLSI